MTGNPQERDSLAGEYVLGVLEGDALATAERLIATDRSFAAAVADWRARLGEIDEAASEVAPSGELWSAIEAALPYAARETPPVSVATARPNPFIRLWDSLSFWRAAAMGAAVAALVLAIGLGGGLFRAAEPRLVAVLLSEGRPGALVQAFEDGRLELVPLQNFSIPADRSYQVWTVRSGEQNPVPIGVLDRPRTTPLATEQPIREDQVFHISVEQKGGSPTGLPLGPVIMTGHARETY